MASIEFAGFVFDGSGTAISNATVNLYDRNTVTPVRATTTSNASGYWTISHATEGRFDIEIVNGTTTRRIKYDSALQLQEIETANLLVRNPANTFKYDIVPAAITADRVLNLPLITGTDTLAVLGLAQTFSAVQTFSGGTIFTTTQVEVADDILFTLGNDNDIAAVNRSTVLAANTALTGVLVGTPVMQATPANSLIIGNITASGDVVVAINNGGNSLEAFRVDASALQVQLGEGILDTVIWNGTGLIVGHNAQLAIGGTVEFQVLGNTGADGAIAVGAFNGNGSIIYGMRSAAATIGGFGIVADNNEVLMIRAAVDDGTDYRTLVGAIQFEVDDASPAASDIGGAVVVYTAPGGGTPDGNREVARWAATGDYTQTVGNMIALAGVRIGADAAGNEIDDATQGAASTTLYIGNAAITVASDARVKDHIEPWVGSGLELLRRVTVVEYDYRDGHHPFGGVYDGKYIGFIAQHLVKVAPWLVNTQGGKDCWECRSGLECADHLPWQARYELLNGVIVKGVQEVDDRVTILERENNELRRRVAALEA